MTDIEVTQHPPIPSNAVERLLTRKFKERSEFLNSELTKANAEIQRLKLECDTARAMMRDYAEWVRGIRIVAADAPLARSIPLPLDPSKASD
jgi:hypothetical protein